MVASFGYWMQLSLLVLGLEAFVFIYMAVCNKQRLLCEKSRYVCHESELVSTELKCTMVVEGSYGLNLKRMGWHIHLLGGMLGRCERGTARRRIEAESHALSADLLVESTFWNAQEKRC